MHLGYSGRYHIRYDLSALRLQVKPVDVKVLLFSFNDGLGLYVRNSLCFFDHPLLVLWRYLRLDFLFDFQADVVLELLNLFIGEDRFILLYVFLELFLGPRAHRFVKPDLGL
jgi:hypothetical protein